MIKELLLLTLIHTLGISWALNPINSNNKMLVTYLFVTLHLS